MRYCYKASFVALVAVSAFAPFLLAQGKGKQAKAFTPSNLPFDPHDISGIWKNPGGCDPL